MSARGDVKNFRQRNLPEWAYHILCQKRLCKIKYGFEGSISNVDLGFFLEKQPTNV